MFYLNQRVNAMTIQARMKPVKGRLGNTFPLEATRMLETEEINRRNKRSV